MTLKAVFDNTTVFKDIPVLGLLHSSKELVNSVSAAIMERNIRLFLFNVKNKEHTADELTEFMYDMGNANYDNGLGHFLSLLERTENINKAQVIFNLMSKRIWDKIDIKMFSRLSEIVNRTPTVDLAHLHEYINNPHYEVGESESLVSTGLLDLPSTFGNGKDYKLSVLGEHLLVYGFGYEIEGYEPQSITHYSLLKA